MRRFPALCSSRQTSLISSNEVHSTSIADIHHNHYRLIRASGFVMSPTYHLNLSPATTSEDALGLTNASGFYGPGNGVA